MKTCVDCGKEIKNNYAKRCKPCYAIFAKQRGSYRVGKPSCEVCGIKLTNYGVRTCRKHSGIIISEALKGKHPSDETRKKLSESHLGHTHTVATRKKMSKSRSGSNHHAWKGGITFDKKTYSKIRYHTPKGLVRGRVGALIRQRLRSRLSGKNWRSTFDVLPYTIDDLIAHLESKFVNGMSWENHGKWHIDHIIPDCNFNYKSLDDDEFKKCWALDNLQPLWAEDNIRKNRKVA